MIRVLRLFVLILMLTGTKPVLAQENMQDYICIGVEVHKQDDTILPLSLEVAAGETQVMRGLMFREELAPQGGMIFIFYPPRDIAMWMKNTLIPLDMLFVKQDGEIVHIHKNAVPHDLTPIYAGQKVMYVIELNGGTADQYGIANGDYIALPPGLLTIR